MHNLQIELRYVYSTPGRFDTGRKQILMSPMHERFTGLTVSFSIGIKRMQERQEHAFIVFTLSQKFQVQ